MSHGAWPGRRDRRGSCRTRYAWVYTDENQPTGEVGPGDSEFPDTPVYVLPAGLVPDDQPLLAGLDMLLPTLGVVNVGLQLEALSTQCMQQLSCKIIREPPQILCC